MAKDQFSKLFVALDEQLLVFEHVNGKWRVESKLDDTSPQSVAMDPFKQNRVYCGTFKNGLMASDDIGKTWKQIAKQAITSGITSILVDRNEEKNGFGILYVGTEPSMLYRSDDGGEQWKSSNALLDLPSAKSWSFPPKPNTHHVRTIVADSKHSGLLYLAIEAGALIRSFDGGKTWKDRVSGGPYDTHNLMAIDGRLYSAAGDGYFESRDHGETWEKHEKGLDQTYLYSVAVNPGERNTLVSASNGPWSAYNAHDADSHVYRKAGDRNWEMVSDGFPPSEGTTVSFLICDDGKFLAANNKGIYESRDTGKSWEDIGVPWQDSFKKGHVNCLALGQ